MAVGRIIPECEWCQAKQECNMRVNYTIVFVSDMQRSIGFYRDVLGLPLKFETPHWSEFTTEGATLALHLGDAPAPDAGNADHDAPGRCRPGFHVPNLDEFHANMARNGVVCIQEPRETFGSRIAQYVDPDGLAFSVSE